MKFHQILIILKAYELILAEFLLSTHFYSSLSGLELLNLSGNALRDLAALGFAFLSNDDELDVSCGLPITTLDLSKNYIGRLPRYVRRVTFHCVIIIFIYLSVGLRSGHYH